jgi:ribosomal-protein-alanine N-acetyltransferase
MPYTLRPMKPGDVPVVAAIDRVSFPTPWPPAAFERELKRVRAYYYVLLRPKEEEDPGSDQGWANRLRDLFGLTRKSRVIGYVGFRLEGDDGHITTIAVRPDWRGRGFGDLLLEVALEEMLDRGAEVATLEMRPSNDVAYALYKKHGFRVEQRRRGYYRDGEDAWVMAAEVDGEAYRQQLARRREALKERFRREQIEVRQDGDAHL